MRLVLAVLLVMGVFSWFEPGAGAVEGPALESLAFERLADGGEVVHFHLNGAHLPKIFMLTGDKPRLVVDFLDTRYRGKSRYTPDAPELIERIRIGIHDKPQRKTRVVIDLAPDRQVSWDQDFLVHQNRLDITIKPDGNPLAQNEEEPAVRKERPAAEVQEEVTVEQSADQVIDLVEPPLQMPSAATAEETGAPAVPVSEVPILLGVSFESKPEKGEMVIFKLDDFHPPVVSAVEKGSPKVICDCYNMEIAGQISETLEVGGEFVEKVRVARHENPGKVRAVLDLVPGRDYGLQQVFFNEDNLFVLIVNLLDGQTSEQPIR